MKDPALTFLVRIGFQKIPLTIVGIFFLRSVAFIVEITTVESAHARGH